MPGQTPRLTPPFMTSAIRNSSRCAPLIAGPFEAVLGVEQTQESANDTARDRLARSSATARVSGRAQMVVQVRRGQTGSPGPYAVWTSPILRRMVTSPYRFDPG